MPPGAQYGQHNPGPDYYPQHTVGDNDGYEDQMATLYNSGVVGPIQNWINPQPNIYYFGNAN